MDKLVNRVIKILERNNAITDGNAEAVRYGMELLFFRIIFYTVVLLVGIIADRIVQMAVFMLFFEPLRIYAGGFHAKSRLNCFFVSVFMLIAAVSAVRFTPENFFFPLSVIFTSASAAVIWFLAPVGTENKELDAAEIFVYRRKSRLILILETVVVIISILFKQYNLPYIISLGLFCSALLLITGCYYNYRSCGIKRDEAEYEK